MTLIELNEKEFRKFALKHFEGNFHQTIEWGIFKSKGSWEFLLLGLINADKLEAACMMLKRTTPVGNIFYSPRGYLIDYNNEELLSIFTYEIKKYAKINDVIFIKIDPYFEYIERDINGKVIDGGFNNEEVYNNLINLGYKHKGFNLNFESLQPRWLFSIDIKNKSLDDVLMNMESKTRQLIRKNIKMNIKTRELDGDNLEVFKKIMDHTSERRGFIDRPFSYYKDMYDVLSEKDMIKFVIAELDTNNYLEILNNEIDEEKKSIDEKKLKIENKEKINVDKTLKAIEANKENIERLNKKVEDLIKLKDKHGDIITLGGILYILYKGEVLSLFGGSYEEFMDYYSFYTIHYEMIKYAIENNYERYNFYGISGDFDEKGEYYGLYDFKRGFGGNVNELIGEFDLVISKPRMVLYNIAMKAYKYLKRIKRVIIK